MDRQTALAMATELGFTPERLQQLRVVPFEQAVLLLTRLKVEAKQRFKKLALRLHPDRNPTDPDAAQKFVVLVTTFREIQSLEIHPPSVQVHVAFVDDLKPVVTPPTTTYFRWRAGPTTTYEAVKVVLIRPE